MFSGEMPADKQKKYEQYKKQAAQGDSYASRAETYANEILYRTYDVRSCMGAIHPAESKFYSIGSGYRFSEDRRSVNIIGFDSDLPALCKKLDAKGIKYEVKNSGPTIGSHNKNVTRINLRPYKLK